MMGLFAKAQEDIDKHKNEKSEPCEGPLEDSARGCTDIVWVPLFILAQLIFLAVTFIGIADGNPVKLYKPRDFMGAYCDVAENWNDGPNTEGFPFMSYTMNVSSVVDQIFQQTVCSTLAKKALVDGDGSNFPLFSTQAEKDEYMCDCCLTPCEKCNEKTNNGGDISSAGGMGLISGRMGELTGLASPADLFNPATSKNGKMFSSNDFWNQATKYFNPVCLPDCNTNFEMMNDSDSRRTYTYQPAMDDPLYNAWFLILTAPSTNTLTNAMGTMINSSFTFDALPESLCPYHEVFCVPMPGMAFGKLSEGSDYCTFEMAADVVDAVGAMASSAFTSMGGEALTSGVTNSFGDFAGDFQRTLDSFIVVGVLSFVIGVIFLVLLRLFVGVCIWIAVLVTVLMFFVGGICVFVRSGQCQDVSFFETGQQNAVAVTVAAKSMAENAISGEDQVSEAMDPEGYGDDYRGVQEVTMSGKACVRWENQTVYPQYTPDDYPDSHLIQNYCRNPFYANQTNKAKTIWCVTSDVNVWWEECIPIGVIQPPCRNGYAVASESARDALWYASFVIWGLGVIWIIIILCFASRIKLAIALNKVAATFVAKNPHIIIVPIGQAVCGIIWMAIWCFSAVFLLSQVPADYTPTGYFATYEEAYGTVSPCAFWEFGDHCEATPGACTDKWPTGFVWKDDQCLEVEGETPQCWRCAPPRYILNERFAVSFFVFLWNNAFNMALGQIIIAMAVAHWFFKQPEQKGLGKIVPGAIKTVFRFHIGSVAFGSFIVALVQFIRYCMKYLEKQAQAQKNRVMVMLLKVVQCILWCFEKCIQFLNKNAYIQIALKGKNFCTSAKAAFWLIMRNALRFGTIAALSNGINAIGYICIISGTTTAGYFIVRLMHQEVSPITPLVSYMAVSYLVARVYMSVFGLAVDTSLQCFITCEENGNIDADFIPPELRDFVDNKSSSEAKKADENESQVI